MDLILARVGAARGLRGEVRLDVRTDSPRTRLAPGTEVRTEPAAAGPLTVVGLREERGGWFARFAEAGDREAAEALAGVEIVGSPAEPEDDAWYPHELAGLAAVLSDGTPVGTVEGLEHLPAHDVLVVRERTGERTLVPFVRAIVPEVDVAAGRVVLDPPGGLLAQFGAVDEDAVDEDAAHEDEERGAGPRVSERDG
jgi:16S rRNA processing protein RimM